MTHQETLVALDAMLRCAAAAALGGVALFTITQLVHGAFWLWDAFDYEGEEWDTEEPARRPQPEDTAP